MMNEITSFSGDHRFLSNFYPSVLNFHDRDYATVEHAFQAFKMTTTSAHDSIRHCRTPGIAKRLARELPRRKDWEQVKEQIMLVCLREKFFKHKDLGVMLLATGSALLVEGNTWGDVYWGVYKAKGENRLGELLMQVRKEMLHAQGA